MLLYLIKDILGHANNALLTELLPIEEHLDQQIQGESVCHYGELIAANHIINNRLERL